MLKSCWFQLKNRKVNHGNQRCRNPEQRTVSGCRAVARENYLNGYGCAESILHALNGTRVLDVPDIVLRASTGFGTGLEARVPRVVL
jgi:hypothetical protein